MLVGRPDELVEQQRVDGSIVVQNQDEIGAVIQRVADAEVVSSRITEITLRVDNLDAVVRRVSTDRIDRTVGRAIVDHDDSVLGVVQTPQRCEAGQCVSDPIPVENDDPHRRSFGHTGSQGLPRVVSFWDVSLGGPGYSSGARAARRGKPALASRSA